MISLLISGNKLSNSGYQPLVAVGNPQLSMTEPSYRQGFESVPGYYEMANGESLRLFVFMANPSKVSSYGSSRYGRLRIELSIPAGTDIILGDSVVSPYTLLEEIRNHFYANNMTFSEVSSSFQFKAENDAQEPFQQIIGKYTLAPSRMKYIPMKGAVDAYASLRSRDLTLSEPKMRERLFLDTGYEEFESIRCLILSDRATPLLQVKEFEVPRTINYALVANGRPRPETVSAEGQTIFVPKASQGSYHFIPAYSFTLEEYRSGRLPEGLHVEVDEVREVITCSMSAQPNRVIKTFRVNLPKEDDLPSDNFSYYALRTSDGSREKVLDSRGEVEFVADEIDMPWVLQYRGPRQDCVLSYSRNAIITERTLGDTSQTVDIYVTVRPVAKPGTDSQYGMILLLPFTKMNVSSPRSIGEVKVILKSDDGLRVVDKVMPEKITQDKTHCICTPIPLSPRWKSALHPVLTFKSEDFESEPVEVMLNKDGVNKIMVPVDFIRKSDGAKGGKKRKKKDRDDSAFMKIYLPIIALVLGLVIGALAMMFLYPKISPSKEKAPTTQTLPSGKKESKDNGGAQNSLAQQGTQTPTPDLPEQGKEEDNASAPTDGASANAPAPSSQTKEVPSGTIAAVGSYVNELKKAELAFATVPSIRQWANTQKKDYPALEQNANFKRLEQYLGYYERAVGIVNDAKAGKYTGKQLYEAVLALSRSATGDDMKQFRLAIQKLGLIDDAKYKDTREDLLKKMLYEDKPSLQNAASFADLRALDFK